MKSAFNAKALFWLVAAAVLFFALGPTSIGSIIESEAERHYLAFLVLPALAAYAWPRVPIPVLWVAFLIFGGLIEFLQMAMNIGRAAEWHDWTNDTIATTISLVVVAVLLRRRPSDSPA